MAITGNLTSEKIADRPFARAWFAGHKDLEYRDDGWSLPELSEHFGVSKSVLVNAYRGLIEPIERRLIGKSYTSIYSAEELRKLGREYQSGKVYKIAANNM